MFMEELHTFVFLSDLFDEQGFEIAFEGKDLISAVQFYNQQLCAAPPLQKLTTQKIA
jgi:hypothetical protein